MNIKSDPEYNDLLNAVIEGILNKKAQNITEINLEKIGSSICRSYVICHGESSTQVRGIADSVEKIVWENLKTHCRYKEGTDNLQWVLLDYNDIIVHIFQKPYRDYYKLEELWADGELRSYNENDNFLNVKNDDKRKKQSKKA